MTEVTFRPAAPADAATIALYRSAGWTLTDRIAHQEYGGLRDHEHVLVKRLPEPRPT